MIVKEADIIGYRRADRNGRQESRLTGPTQLPAISRPNWTKTMSAKEHQVLHRCAQPDACAASNCSTTPSR